VLTCDVVSVVPSWGVYLVSVSAVLNFRNGVAIVDGRDAPLVPSCPPSRRGYEKLRYHGNTLNLNVTPIQETDDQHRYKREFHL